MNVRNIAMKAAVLKALQDEVEAQGKAARAEAKAAFTETGSTATVPKLPDGTKIATVTLAGGESMSAFVAGDDEFEAWVLASHPEEMQMVVRPGFKEKVLDAAAKAGAPVTKEGEAIPGVVVRKSTPYVSVRFTPTGKVDVAAAWRAGELAELGITGPGGPAQIEAHPEAA